MKKNLMILAVVFLAVAIAMPAFAEVTFKYGGQFRVRFFGQDNVFDGTNKPFSSNYNSVDDRRMIDQRLRLYFTFEGSKNLKLVTGFEIGDSIWGQSGNIGGSTTVAGTQMNTGHNLGANLGGDAVAIEVKNLYIDFNIPNTPTKALIGLQPIVVLDSWILGDDIPAALFVTKLDPFTVTLGYAGGQNGWERAVTTANRFQTTDDRFNVDDFLLSLDYAQGPFKASLIGLMQFGHDSMMSIDPTTLQTPNRGALGASYAMLNQPLSLFGVDFRPENNMLVDFGLNLTYKTDWLLAYVNFVRNFGGVDGVAYATAPNVKLGQIGSSDYNGWMVDAGVTYFCGPWTANIGGFYTSGPDFANTLADANSMFGPDGAFRPFKGYRDQNINWFTYPSGVQKASSEIIGGGILGEDLYTVRGYSGAVNAAAIGSPSGLSNGTQYWRGWYNPQNVWTITLGGSYQLTPSTKFSASYWYWGTSSEVPVALYVAGPNTGAFKMSDSIGHELNFYLDQKIMDGLTLTLVGAYLFADDAFAPVPATITAAGLTNPGGQQMWLTPDGTRTRLLAEDAWEVGARLQWNF